VHYFSIQKQHSNPSSSRYNQTQPINIFAQQKQRNNNHNNHINHNNQFPITKPTESKKRKINKKHIQNSITHDFPNNLDPIDTYCNMNQISNFKFNLLHEINSSSTKNHNMQNEHDIIFGDQNSKIDFNDQFSFNHNEFDSPQTKNSPSLFHHYLNHDNININHHNNNNNANNNSNNDNYSNFYLQNNTISDFKSLLPQQSYHIKSESSPFKSQSQIIVNNNHCNINQNVIFDNENSSMNSAVNEEKQNFYQMPLQLQPSNVDESSLFFHPISIQPQSNALFDQTVHTIATTSYNTNDQIPHGSQHHQHANMDQYRSNHANGEYDSYSQLSMKSSSNTLDNDQESFYHAPHNCQTFPNLISTSPNIQVYPPPQENQQPHAVEDFDLVHMKYSHSDFTESDSEELQATVLEALSASSSPIPNHASVNSVLYHTSYWKPNNDTFVLEEMQKKMNLSNHSHKKQKAAKLHKSVRTNSKTMDYVKSFINHSIHSKNNNLDAIHLKNHSNNPIHNGVNRYPQQKTKNKLNKSQMITNPVYSMNNVTNTSSCDTYHHDHNDDSQAEEKNIYLEDHTFRNILLEQDMLHDINTLCDLHSPDDEHLFEYENAHHHNHIDHFDIDLEHF
jgi:hypothetical protein